MARFYYTISVTLIVLLYFQSEANSKMFNHFTIFSVLHKMPNDDVSQHFIQNAAIWSWSQVVPKENILLFFDDDKSCKFVEQFYQGIKCIILSPVDCIHPQYKRPFMSCIFNLAQQYSRTSILMFLNGDIMLDSSTFSSIDFVSRTIDDFFVVGCRRDYEVDSLLNVTDPKQVLTDANIYSKLHHTTAIDLIAFRSKIKIEMLPFLVGVYRWDNWLLSEAILRSNKTVVDITESCQIIHLQPKPTEKKQILPHPDRPGAVYNDVLTKNASGLDYIIGSIGNAHRVLAGNCLKNECELKDNLRQNERVLLRLRADPNRYITVLAVNSGYMDLAWNWLCWTKRIKFVHYVLLAEDLRAYEILKAAGEPVFIGYNQTLNSKVKSEAKYGTVEFQETMLYRLDFLMRVLKLGYHMLSADMDGIWLSDPLKYISLNKSITLQGQTHKKTKLSGGFIMVHATPAGRKFWQEIIRCQVNNLEKIRKENNKKRVISDLTEQECINDRLHTVKRKFLDEYLFPDGRSFFTQQLPQQRGIVPVVIHGNWIIGLDAKVQRLKSWNLLASVNRSCEMIQSGIPFKKRQKQKSFALHIRVLTFNRFNSLKRLLDSLQNANYLNDAVTLEILVDHPAVNSENADIEEWQKIVNYLGKGNPDTSSFRWKHGPFSIIIQPKHIGIFGQWVLPINSSDVYLFLEDDIVLSKYYYIFLKKAVSFYYLNETNYDNLVYGLSLQNQHTILGQRTGYPLKTMEKQFNETGFPTFYKYQLLGTWGTVFFPEHWSTFLKWLQEKNQTDITAACTPNLMSTNWWVQRGQEKMWTPWFIRFAFERGWYSIYMNFPQQEAFATSYREAGLNFHDTRGPMNQVITSLNPSLHFNFTRDLPVYDFFFEKVDHPELLSIRSNLWHPDHFIDQCYFPNKKTKHSTTKSHVIKRGTEPSYKLKKSKLKKRSSKADQRKMLGTISSPSSLHSDFLKDSIIIETMLIFPAFFIVFTWAYLIIRRRSSRMQRHKK